MGVIPDVKTQNLLVGTIRHAWLVVREECGVVRLTAMLPAQLVTQAARHTKEKATVMQNSASELSVIKVLSHFMKCVTESTTHLTYSKILTAAL